MKFRAISLTLALLLAAALALPAGAVLPEGPSEALVTTPGIEGTVDQQAQMLAGLGLLWTGDPASVDWAAPLTATEALVETALLLGAGPEAASNPPACAYDGVPAWAAPYVGWLDGRGYLAGREALALDPAGYMTFPEYADLLLTVLLGRDTGAPWFFLTDGHEAVPYGDGPLPRSAALGLTLRALTMASADAGGGSLLRGLLERGVFTARQLVESSREVLPRRYETDGEGRLCLYLLDVAAAVCPEPGLTLLETPEDPVSAPWLAAARMEAEDVVVATLDPETLNILSENHSGTAGVASLTLHRVSDGLAYVSETVVRDGEARCGAVLRLSPTGIYRIARGEDLGGGEAPPAVSLTVTAREDGPIQAAAVVDDTLYAATESGIETYPWLRGASLLDWQDRTAVATRPTGGGGLEILLWDLETGRREDDRKLPPKEGVDQVSLARVAAGVYAGSAGAYDLVGGQLRFLESRATVDVAYSRLGGVYLLTYTPGVTPLYQGRQTGDAIWCSTQMTPEAFAVTCLLPADSGHGIRLLAFESSSVVRGVAPSGIVYGYAYNADMLPILAQVEDPWYSWAFYQENIRLRSLGILGD